MSLPMSGVMPFFTFNSHVILLLWFSDESLSQKTPSPLRYSTEKLGLHHCCSSLREKSLECLRTHSGTLCGMRCTAARIRQPCSVKMFSSSKMITCRFGKIFFAKPKFLYVSQWFPSKISYLEFFTDDHIHSSLYIACPQTQVHS